MSRIESVKNIFQDFNQLQKAKEWDEQNPLVKLFKQILSALSGVEGKPDKLQAIKASDEQAKQLISQLKDSKPPEKEGLLKWEKEALEEFDKSCQKIIRAGLEHRVLH